MTPTGTCAPTTRDRSTPGHRLLLSGLRLLRDRALAERHPLRGGRCPALPAHLRHPVRPLRSEEHTSELQSRGHLVCRLLLEKKKYRVPNLLASIRRE